MIELRPYQNKALDKIYSDLKIFPEVLLSGMMGCGKTIMTVRLIQRLYNENPGMKFLILMHKQELVQQFYDSFQKFTQVPFRHVGVCCAGLNQKKMDRQITIATIQTFVNQKEQYEGAGLIIIDEAHRIDINSDSQYKKTFDYLRLQRPNSRILGITATPSRLGHGYCYGTKCKPGSVNLFPELNHTIQYEELRQEGYLVKLKGVVASHESLEKDLAGVSVHGDYVLDQIGEIMSQERHLHTAVEAIETYCAGYKRICVFCCTIDHAEQLKKLIGHQATTVHSKLNPLKRQINMTAWESGEKRIITSVNILTEGFDMPVLDCLVFARPTLSSTLFLQAVGRVLRTHKDKDHGLLVDLTDNTSRFGTNLDKVKVTVPKTVEDAEKKEQEIIKLCPECELEVHIALRECPECGFQWPEAECIIAEVLPNMEEVTFEKQEPVWYNITHCEIAIHISKKNGKKLGKLTIKYEQTRFYEKTVYLFFCMPDYYSGGAVNIAKEKWGMVSDGEFPANINEFQDADWNEPVRVLVDENNKFPEIIDVECKIPEKKYYNPDDDDFHEDLTGMEKPTMDIEYDFDDIPF